MDMNKSRSNSVKGGCLRYHIHYDTDRAGLTTTPDYSEKDRSDSEKEKGRFDSEARGELQVLQLDEGTVLKRTTL